MDKDIYGEHTDEESLFMPYTFQQFMKSKGAEFIADFTIGDKPPGDMFFHFKNTTVVYHISNKSSPPFVRVTLYGDETNIGKVEKIILKEETTSAGVKA